MYDLIIIGGGMAGYTAAIYSSRYSLKTLLIEKKSGGNIMDTPLVENFPGFISISGKDLMQKVKDQAASLKVETAKGEVIDIRKKSKESKEFTVKTAEKEYSAKTVVLALGTKKRPLGVPGEKEFKGKGVSECATCDGAFFKNKTAAVIGGGNSAYVTSSILLQYVKKLYVIDIAEKLFMDPFLLERLKKDNKVTIMPATGIKEIKGKNKVESIITTKEELQVDGVFVDIGFIPPKELTEKAGIELDQKGYIKVDAGMKTNIAGIFAAGDITTASNYFWQLVTAAGEGAIAAKSAFDYIKGLR